MSEIAQQLSAWAHDLVPTDDDLALAERSLRDTVAVALAAEYEPVLSSARCLGEAGLWATAAHVLDFDDLHLQSTSHLSAVIAPVVASCGGDALAYLAGCGVMARLGNALGWDHYALGWHTTCTAGTLAAAVAAAISFGLDRTATAYALALSVSAAGGVQRAFGTDAKSLQVGLAADAGVRAALLAALGARADLLALEQWLQLVTPSARAVDIDGPTVPGGLAVKLYPCCYAMQRPIAAIREQLADLNENEVEHIVVTTPATTIQPLIHHRPTNGLQAKFSLEYAIATAFLDRFPDRQAFTDDAIARPAARRLVESVEVQVTQGEGNGLLAGELGLRVYGHDGSVRIASLSTPPGAPGRPLSVEDLDRKIQGCGDEIAVSLREITWPMAASLLRDRLGRGINADTRALRLW
jgi:2-methylcitrate dehydratase PrpD